MKTRKTKTYRRDIIRGFVVAVVASIAACSWAQGATWQEMDSPTTELLHGVWGAASDDVYAVGTRGIILHYDGTEWSIEVSPSDDKKDIQNIWGSGANDIWAVGHRETVLHRHNGSAWQEITTIPAPRGLFGVWGTPAGDVWVVGAELSSGQQGTVWYYSGEAPNDPENWEQVLLDPGPSGGMQLRRVWGREVNNVLEVFAVDHMGSVEGVCYKYDSVSDSWHPEWSSTGWPSMREYSDIWGTENELFIVGQSTGWFAQLYHGVEDDNGSYTWTGQNYESYETLGAVWGSAGDNVYMVGTGGLIVHYDGSTWSVMDTPTTEILTYVWGTDEGDVFAVGFNGTILHLEPPCTPVSLNSLTADPLVVQLGNAIDFEATISDGCGEVDALWDFDDGTIDSQANVTNPVTTTKTYDSVGVYTVVLAVSDDVDDDGDNIIVVVYDPTGGFITGGGWIDSPEGAYKPDPSLTGKANFGFVSKYKKGANVPTGNTEFQFKTADLNFHSSSYQWLVVNQNDTNAQFKGSGTINGAGEYKFMLWAGDGEPDTFRIKIWYEDGGEVVVYDNGFNQAIGGGSIIVHKGKK